MEQLSATQSSLRKVQYSDTVRLGFKVVYCKDAVYEKKYGFKYAIITKQLTKRIYVQYDKEVQQTKVVRINKNGDIKGTMYVKDIKTLENLIKFYND